VDRNHNTWLRLPSRTVCHYPALAGEKNLDLPQSLVPYLPYIVVGAVFLSYVVGFSAHLVMERAISKVYPSTVASAAQLLAIRSDLPAPVQDAFGQIYKNLVMFRHLFCAFLLLEISLLIWLRKSSLPKPHMPAYGLCLFFIALFLYAYCIQRDMYMDFKKELKIEYPCVQFTEAGGCAAHHRQRSLLA